MFKRTILAAAALSLLAGAAFADSYKITVTNNLAEELFAPIVAADIKNDHHFFKGNYVTPEAEVQVLTGDPAMVIKAIGDGTAAVGHGTDGPPGVLLAPGGSVSFTLDTDAAAIRIFSMVAPTMVPDNYVTAVAELHGMSGSTIELNRFDIGHDEGTKMDKLVAKSVGTVTITKM